MNGTVAQLVAILSNNVFDAQQHYPLRFMPAHAVII
jgi:hypothetical protein